MQSGVLFGRKTRSQRRIDIVILVVSVACERLVKLAHRLSPARVIPIQSIDSVEHGPVIKMIRGQAPRVSLRLAFAQSWIHHLFLGEGVTR